MTNYLPFVLMFLTLFALLLTVSEGGQKKCLKVDRKKTPREERQAKVQKIVDTVNSKPDKSFEAEAHDYIVKREDWELERLASVDLTRFPHTQQNSDDNDENDDEAENSNAVHGKGNAHKRPKRQIIIPISFDSRKQWPKCAQQIGNIRTQSRCGSCWAVSVAAMLTDRRCIHKSKNNLPIEPLPFELSAADLLSCSGAGDCNTGGPYYALGYAVKNGLVSGANASYYPTGNCTRDYRTDDPPTPFHPRYCMPYPFPYECCIWGCEMQTCSKECTNINWNNTYQQDKQYLAGGAQYALKQGYFRGANQIPKIQEEILKNGPVVAVMYAYRDFLVYKSGIYVADNSTYNQAGANGHAIRILGWGEGKDASGNTKKYWLVANSYGTNWGENGYVRVAFGAGSIDSLELHYATFNTTNLDAYGGKVHPDYY